VPHGYDGDATDAVLGQIERFAPGFREQVLMVAARGPLEMATYNANYVGGDISAGANTARQILARPRAALDPYATGVPGVYLCSSATPPGAGVHGMGGFHAANTALRWLHARV
jgi:phytoene dehydrogenase-like protein